ncbi:rhombosortase [Pseudoduganella sp. FT93W]|uniref:Rhombosortase n=1 Tax=Duganella fentianensis TaxID=2692177 RepID=A0A845HZJ6_9BURK|nr:rhombosortase [Duganella fentianensis]MYN46399.1 rhombosortase [Duganella fentianensis]
MASAAAPAKWPSASALLALVALVLVYAPPQLIDLLAYDRQAILSGQWWRLWSGHLVHYSAWHALVDVAMLLLCGCVLEPLIGTRRLCLSLSCSAPLMAIALMSGVPALAHYRGLSGLVVMMATMTLIALWRGAQLPRHWLVLLTALLLLKTGCEALGISTGSNSLPPGIRVMWQAHVLGVALGLLEAALNSRLTRPTRAERS